MDTSEPSNVPNAVGAGVGANRTTSASSANSSALANLTGIIVFDTSMSSVFFTPSLRRTPHALDDLGAKKGCSSFMRDTSELVVGREEGVFSYSIDDRGGAAGLEGVKQSVGAVGRYRVQYLGQLYDILSHLAIKVAIHSISSCLLSFVIGTF